MKHSSKAWIPAVLFGLPALALLGLTLLGSLHSAPYEGLSGGAFQGLTAFSAVLSLTDLYTVLLRSLLLRAGSALGGGLLGLGISLLLAKAPQKARAFAGALLLLPLFIPSVLWDRAFLPAQSSFTVRTLLVTGLKAAGLSAFAGCLFLLRGRRTGALLAVLALLCAFLSPDMESTLLGTAAGDMTLDTWSLARVRDPLAIAASFVRMAAEPAAAVLCALLVHSLTLGTRPARVERPGERPLLLPAAVFGTAVLFSCLVLLPFLLRGATLTVEEEVRALLPGSLAAAAAALPAALLAAFLVLFAQERSGRGAFALTWTALFLLSSFSPAKPLLYSLAGLGGTVVPTALDAAFSQEVLVLLMVLSAFGFRQRTAYPFAAAGLSLLAACRAAVSLSGLRIYGREGLVSLPAAGAESANADLVILCLCLCLYALSALCFSRLLLWDPPAEKRVKVGQSQGLKPSGIPAPRVSAPAVQADRQRPLFEAPEESVPSDTPQVPASSAYAEQFAQNTAWMPPKTPSPSLPAEEEIEEAPLPVPEEAVQESAPAAPEAQEPASWPDSPSPVQVVSLINALTKMRSMGIVSDAEYREKRDRLMKML